MHTYQGKSNGQWDRDFKGKEIGHMWYEEEREK